MKMVFEIKIFDKWLSVKSYTYDLCRSKKRVRVIKL